MSRSIQEEEQFEAQEYEHVDAREPSPQPDTSDTDSADDHDPINDLLHFTSNYTTN